MGEVKVIPRLLGFATRGGVNGIGNGAARHGKDVGVREPRKEWKVEERV